jgi:hypothetical protein
MLSHEDHQRHFRDAGDPGIANQLRIKREQPDGRLRRPAGGALPVRDTSDAIQLADGIDIGNKLIRVRQVP